MAYQIDGDDELSRMQVKFHPRVKLVTLGEVKRSNIIKFRLICQFQRFLYQTLCVKIKKNISGGIFILSHRSCPRVGLWVAGCPGGHFFSNMVMWHIKSTGMASRTNRK